MNIEKVLLTKNIANISDLRQEVFHLNRDLAKERLKVTALEEEVQTPLNVHRWRKLEVRSAFLFRQVSEFCKITGREGSSIAQCKFKSGARYKENKEMFAFSL